MGVKLNWNSMETKIYPSREEAIAAIERYIKIAEEMGLTVSAYNGVSYCAIFRAKDGEIKALDFE